ncbi:MAG: hypothetical protein KGN77_05190 [Xanthomonadaceae bacterium]|nr:hypothetical protein [Xanthomonadaceae bacterium]
MGVIDDIRTGISEATIGAFADSSSIEYRNLTSNLNASPRTYSTWTSLAGARVIDGASIQVQDPDSGLWFLEKTAQLRIPFTLSVALTITSQVRTGGSGAGSQVWDVREVQPGAAGSVQPYRLVYRTPILEDPRKGAV